MLTLFIFKSNARGMQYGIGTYIRELTEALLEIPCVKIYLVAYHNNEVKEFSIKTINEKYFEVNIPSPKSPPSTKINSESRYAKAVANLLAGIISINDEIIFQMNHLNDLSIIKVFKQLFPYPVVSVVHLSQSEQLFNGNKQKINSLNFDALSKNEEFTIFSEKEMYILSDHIVTINPYMREFLIEKFGLPPGKMSIIRNGLNFSRFSKIAGAERIKLKLKLGFNSYEKIILFSGRIDPDKGIFFLIDAFLEACKERDDLRLVFIGQGNAGDILHRCNDFFGRITFTGFLQPQKLIEFYRIADMGMVPSVYELCSYSRLEMIANRIPLILTKIEGFSDMLEFEQCVFINPIINTEGAISFNIDEFRDAILSLAGNKQLAETYATNAYHFNVNKYSSSVMAREMYQIFKGLCRTLVEI
jgi:glycosyltransferase involved in cell wall biosynthesis